MDWDFIDDEDDPDEEIEGPGREIRRQLPPGTSDGCRIFEANSIILVDEYRQGRAYCVASDVYDNIQTYVKSRPTPSLDSIRRAYVERQAEIEVAMKRKSSEDTEGDERPAKRANNR